MTTDPFYIVGILVGHPFEVCLVKLQVRGGRDASEVQEEEVPQGSVLFMQTAIC